VRFRKLFKDRDFIFLMGLKNWPYWLKGFLVGIILDIIIILVSRLNQQFAMASIFGIFGVFAFFGIPIFISLSILPIFSLIIGLIVGKIKSPRQE